MYKIENRKKGRKFEIWIECCMFMYDVVLLVYIIIEVFEV